MEPEEFANKVKNDEENTEYIGNMWGWKFSLFGLVLIVGMSGLTYYSHITGRLDMRTGEPMKKEIPQDTPLIDSLDRPQ